MKKLVGLTWAIALMASVFSAILPNYATAEEIKPIVTVSFAGYDEVRANIEAVGKLGGNPDLAKGLENFLDMVTQGKGLSVLDKSAPWGAVCYLQNESEPVTFGFVPVVDLKQLVELLKNTPAAGMITESDGGYEVMNPNGESMFVAQKGKLALIVHTKAELENVPDDPVKLLGDLPKKYLLGIRADVKNVPDSKREMALTVISMMMQGSMQQMEDESEEDFALRQKMTQRSLDQMTMFVKETDQILFGLNIDRKTNKISFDTEITAQKGSKLAEELTKGKRGKSNMAGFDLPGAAVVANSLSALTDNDVEEVKDALQSMKSQMLKGVEGQELTEEQMKLCKEMVDEALAIAEKNLETKKNDAGFALMLEPEALTAVVGAVVVDGKPIDKLVKKFFDAAKQEEPSLADLVKFDAEKYKGIAFHTLSIPTPEEAEELKPLVGDTLEVVLGVGDKQVFVAAGRNAAKVLKEAIDRTQANAGKEVTPFQVTFSALQIAKFFAAVAPEEEAKAAAQSFVGMMEKSSGKDHIILSTESIANGMRVHLELEEGFMQALGEHAATMGGLGMLPGAN